MPEREVVAALNVCTTMAAKSKLMQGKGMVKDTDPLSEIRAWFRESAAAPSAAPAHKQKEAQVEEEDEEQEAAVEQFTQVCAQLEEVADGEDIQQAEHELEPDTVTVHGTGSDHPPSHRFRSDGDADGG